MPDGLTREQTTEWTDQVQDQQAPLNDPVPGTDDPGGAHAKGFSADPRPEKAVADEGPVPLVSVPDGESGVRQPERDGKVQPTGRGEPGSYTPNDRLMGSDR